jgi:hypothetical protein
MNAGGHRLTHDQGQDVEPGNEVGGVAAEAQKPPGTASATRVFPAWMMPGCEIAAHSW